MKIEWNKVTWYSKVLAPGIFLVVLGLSFLFGAAYQDATYQQPLLSTIGVRKGLQINDATIYNPCLNLPVRGQVYTSVSVPLSDTQVRPPSGCVFVKNIDNPNGSGSFDAYYFVRDGEVSSQVLPKGPYLEGIRFFSEATIKAKETEPECVEGTAACEDFFLSAKDYEGLYRAYLSRKDYPNFIRQIINERQYYIRNDECQGDDCAIRSYITFENNTMAVVFAFIDRKQTLSSKADALVNGVAFTSISKK